MSNSPGLAEGQSSLALEMAPPTAASVPAAAPAAPALIEASEPSPPVDRFSAIRNSLAHLSSQADAIFKQGEAINKSLSTVDHAKRTAEIVIAQLAAQRDKNPNAPQDLPSAGDQTSRLDAVLVAVQSFDTSLKALASDRKVRPAHPSRFTPWMIAAALVIAVLGGGAMGAAAMHFAAPGTPAAAKDTSGGWAQKIWTDIGPSLVNCYKESNGKGGAPVNCAVSVSYGVKK